MQPGIMKVTGAMVALALLSGCALVSLNMGKAVPLPEATRAKALGSFPVEGACAIYNPLAGGVRFSPLTTDGSNLDDPSSMGCKADMEFTPDGAGLLVLVGRRLQRVDWRTGKVVWSRTLIPESSYGWSNDRRWLVVSEAYGEPEQACWPFFEGGDKQFCQPSPLRRVRPQTVDPATGAAVSVDGVAKAGWARDPYHFGAIEKTIPEARRLVDLRTGAEIPVRAPGEHVATGDAMIKRLTPGAPGVWLGPTDFDVARGVSLWLRVVPDTSGLVCVNPALWALEIAAYRDGAPVWSHVFSCASPSGNSGAWYSPDAALVGVQHVVDPGNSAFTLLDARSGKPVTDKVRVNGEPYAPWVATAVGSDLSKLNGYEIGPVISDTGALAKLSYDWKGVPANRYAVVADIATGEIIARHDMGEDESNDGRHPSVAISRDGKLLALFDTTGAVTVIPSGAP